MTRISLQVLALILMALAPTYYKDQQTMPLVGIGYNAVVNNTPTLIQGPFTTPNDVLIQSPMASNGTGTFMVTCFANATQVNDTIIVKLTTAQTTAADISVTDDGSSSNTYAVPSGATETAGSHTIAFYVATVAHASHCVTTTFTVNSANNADNQMVMWEYSNLGSVDVTCSGTATSGTAPACGSSMTTTVNGDLIIVGMNVVSYSSKPSGFTTYTAQTGTSPTWTLSDADGTSWSVSQTGILATAGAVTPSITTASAVTRANIVGLSFKPTATGGTVASKPYLIDEQVFNSGTSSAWGFSSDSTSTTQAVQTPCQGNSLWLLLGQVDSLTISNVTDTNSNTWAGLTRLDSTGDGFAIQWWHTTNSPATCNGTEKITVTYSGNPAAAVPLWVFEDVSAAFGYDSSATCGAGSTPCAINTTCALGNIAGSTITPSGYPALVLGYQNQDFGTISGVSVGQFIAAYESCPNASTGCSGVTTSKVAYAGSGFEQDAGIVASVLASGSLNPTWTYANTQNTAAGACFSSTVSIK